MIDSSSTSRSSSSREIEIESGLSHSRSCILIISISDSISLSLLMTPVSRLLLHLLSFSIIRLIVDEFLSLLLMMPFPLHHQVLKVLEYQKGFCFSEVGSFEPPIFSLLYHFVCSLKTWQVVSYKRAVEFIDFNNCLNKGTHGRTTLVWCFLYQSSSSSSTSQVFLSRTWHEWANDQRIFFFNVFVLRLQTDH